MELVAMGVNTNLRNAVLAIDALRKSQDASANLKPLASPMTEEELRQRAELVEKVIQTRSKLKLLRDRSEELRAALNRFKERRAKSA
jgi:hypothetical protein